MLVATRCFPAILLPLALAVAACSDSAQPPLRTCASEAPAALRTCVSEAGEAIAACRAAGGGACGAEDPGVAAALSTVESRAEVACGTGGFGTLDPDAVPGRLRASCLAEASSIAWRTYGGPQAAAWSAADDDDRDCLASAHDTARRLVDDSLEAIAACATPGACVSEALAARRGELEGAARAEIDAACPELSSLVAVDSTTYVARAARQADCIAATGHPDASGLRLACGPDPEAPSAPRGEWLRIPVDPERWGARCGDGSDFSFWVRLAPAGSRLDRVLVGLQGGGVCLFEDDCKARLASSPGLFTAADDDPRSLESGIASNDPAESPFADWTKVYLPYCNQDVFAGGGVVEKLGSVEVPRFGGVNLRAALEITRNLLWREMDAAGGAGYRADEVVALFGGWSAGGYGTLYNYHFLIDDLLWSRTAAFPDAGLALDNGSILGVRGLGPVKIPAWGTRNNLPPYCFTGECSVGTTIARALAPRLRQVPEQQMLLLSNQKDETQRRDAFFDSEAQFVNTMRRTYCETKDLNGIHYFLTSVSAESVHVVSPRPNLWNAAVAGETMRDWVLRAIEQPDTLESRAEEGDFVRVIPGVEPFPCAVAP